LPAPDTFRPRRAAGQRVAKHAAGPQDGGEPRVFLVDAGAAGTPGHHLQFAQTLAEQENLNRWQRLMCWVSGSGEGWATYAERLMGELGYLDDDPGAYLGMLDLQLMSAANVALDIGMHLELEIPAGEKRLRFELHRYLGWPGQVTSYKLGERSWLQARDEARTRTGDSFSRKDFHTRALSLGATGLDPLREALARS
jgi:uncharacterized protein (DUF885 family)